MKRLCLVFLIHLFYSLAGFAAQDSSTFAFSTNLKPKFEAKYYIDQGLNYFDTLDSYVTNVSKPIVLGKRDSLGMVSLAEAHGL